MLRDEADRGVQRQVRRYGAEVLRIERQQALHALQRIQHGDTGEAEGQQPEGVGRPGLFLGRIDAGDPVEHGLQRTEQALKWRGATLDDAGYGAAQRPDRGDDQRREQGDLRPALPGHVVCRSGGCGGQVRSRQARTYSAAPAKAASDRITISRSPNLPLPRCARERSRHAAARVRVIGPARSTCYVPARSPEPSVLSHLDLSRSRGRGKRGEI